MLLTSSSSSKGMSSKSDSSTSTTSSPTTTNGEKNDQNFAIVCTLGDRVGLCQAGILLKELPPREALLLVLELGRLVLFCLDGRLFGLKFAPPFDKCQGGHQGPRELDALGLGNEARLVIEQQGPNTPNTSSSSTALRVASVRYSTMHSACVVVSHSTASEATEKIMLIPRFSLL